MFTWWGHCRSGSLKVCELDENFLKWFLGCFVCLFLEAECLDCKYEFCSGAATQDIGGLEYSTDTRQNKSRSVEKQRDVFCLERFLPVLPCSPAWLKNQRWLKRGMARKLLRL